MLWRSASEPWHRAWRLILREDGVHGTGRGEGQATARVPLGPGGPGRAGTAPAATSLIASAPAGAPVEDVVGLGPGAARGQGRLVSQGLPCHGAPPAPGQRGPRSLSGDLAKCKGRGSISQCPQVRSHLPQHWGTGSVAAVRGVGMDIQQHCAAELSRGAAASRAPLEPIHDLLTSETQLRNSPSGKGTSLVGLEKDMVGHRVRGGGRAVLGGQEKELGQLGRGAEPLCRAEGRWKGPGGSRVVQGIGSG